MKDSFKYFRFLFVFLLFSRLVLAENHEKYPETASHPKIVLEKLVKDFGQVNAGVVLEEDFIVANEGGEDLIIRSLNPACGCTSAVLNNPVIKPKQKSAIRISFNTTGFSGEKEKTIRVYSNDPLNSSLVISVKADILEELSVTPRVLDLGEILQSEGFREELRISNALKAEPFSITEVVSKSSFIKYDITSNGPSGYIVKVFTEGYIPLGRTRSRIIFRTDKPNFPLITVPIVFYAQGELVASPKAINFGLIKRSQISSDSLERVVRFKKSSEAVRAKVLNVDVSNRAVDAELEEDTDGQYVRVRINSLAAGIVRGLIKLETDSLSEDAKVIEIPYFAMVEGDSFCLE